MRSHPTRTAALLFALIVAAFYSPVLLFGKSLLSPLYYPRGVTAEGAYGFAGRRPVNTFNVELSSAAYYEAPLNRLVGQLYRQGRLPLWNPYQGAGMPLAAQYSSRAFFPYQIAEDLSPVWAWDLFMLGRLWLAGILTFLFLGEVGASPGAAFLGGLFYMLSGTMVWWINFEQMTNAAMMLPLMLLGVARQVRHSRIRDLVVSAGAVALVLLAGQPEIALYVLFLTGLFALVFAWLRIGGVGRRVRVLAGVAAAVPLGLALAAPLLAPFVEGMREMVSIHPVGAGMGVRDPIPWKYLLGIVIPSMFEYPIVPRQLPDNGMWDYLGGYVGITPLFLAAAGLVTVLLTPRPRHRGLVIFFAAFGVGLILKHHGWPPFLWIGYLPFFDITWSQRWSAPVWTFSLAAAGGLGWDAVREATAARLVPSGRGPGWWPARPRPLRIPPVGRILLAVAAVMLLLLVILTVAEAVSVTVREAILWLERPPANPPLEMDSLYFWPSIALAVALAVLILGALTWLTLRHPAPADRWLLGVAALALVELWFAIPRGYPPLWASLKVVPLLIGLAAAAACVADRKRVAAGAAAAALIAFAALDYTAPAGFPDRFDPFAPAPYVEFLKRQAGHPRIVASGDVLTPNFASALGVLDLRYVAALSVKSVQAYRSRLLHAYPLWDAAGDALWFNGQPFLYVRVVDDDVVRVGRIHQPLAEDVRARLAQYSFLGVRFIAVSAHDDLNRGGARPRFPLVYDGEVKIYENPAALPRAFVARRIGYARTYEEAQQVSNAPGFDPRTQVVLEEPAPAGYALASPVAGRDAVEITRYEASAVTVRARSVAPGMLVLTDAFYPGWEARVDGQPAKIYRVNGVVRGVFVPEGARTVEFSYFPASLRIGLGVCAAALAACLGLLVTPAFVRRR